MSTAEVAILPDWSQYSHTYNAVSANTVDRLKKIIRYINVKTGRYSRTNGLKAQLVDCILIALRKARQDDNLIDFSYMHYAIYNAHILERTPASTSYGYQGPASSPQSETGYQNPGYQKPNYGATTSMNGQPSSTNGYAHNSWSTNNGVANSNYSKATVQASRQAAFAAHQSAHKPYGSSSQPSPPLPSPSLHGNMARSGPNPTGQPITFRPNPFYTIKEAVSSVVCCQRAAQGDRRVVPLSFTLTDSQRQLLLAARASKTNPQYQLRVFCCSETYYNPAVSSYPGANRSPQMLGPAPVEFPSQSELKLNGTPVNANLRGIKKKEGSTMPPDLGKVQQIQGTAALRLLTGDRNIVDMVYINSPDKRYYLMIYMVQFFSIAELIEQVKAMTRRSKEEVEKEIIAQNADPDIVATSSVLNLKCPLSFVRLATPIRSKGCSHWQCFEAESFFSMNEQTPSWNCPQCNKVLKMADLFVDEYTDNILQTVPSSYDTVVVEIDATWRTEDFKHGTSKSVNQSPPPKKQPSAVKAESIPVEEVGNKSSAVEILDSDEDDVPNRKFASKLANSRKVIDLTLSDDEDEQSPATASVPLSRTNVPSAEASFKDTTSYPPTSTTWKRPRQEEDEESELMPPPQRMRAYLDDYGVPAFE